jgi:predicted negative regulator of RcsB-dependent stress response
MANVNAKLIRPNKQHYAVVLPVSFTKEHTESANWSEIKKELINSTADALSILLDEVTKQRMGTILYEYNTMENDTIILRRAEQDVLVEKEGV